MCVRARMRVGVWRNLCPARVVQVAINVDPSCREAHIRLADTLSALGREDEAKSHYEEALKADPNYKWGHVNLGLSLERQVRVPAHPPPPPTYTHRPPPRARLLAANLLHVGGEGDGEVCG